MATSTLTVTSTFTRTNGLQADQSTPVSIPVFTDSTPTQVFQQELLLPAAGSSVTLPIPSYWATITQVQIVNIDTTGYVALTLNGTSGPISIGLAPNGGTFATSLYATALSGSVAPTPKTWTLKSMASDGTTAGAAATNCLIYIAGL